MGGGEMHGKRSDPVKASEGLDTPVFSGYFWRRLLFGFEDKGNRLVRGFVSWVYVGRVWWRRAIGGGVVVCAHASINVVLGVGGQCVCRLGNVTPGRLQVLIQ